jgi:hypothetical protein
MGVIEMVKRLKAIDKECNKNEELKKRLEPWVEEMNKQKPRTREEATKITQAFIEKYEEIKKQIGESHGQNKCVRKIE